MKINRRRLQRKLVSTVKRLAASPRTALTWPSNNRRASDRPPIFIVGCPRSGTTLMRQILDSHSRIACPGETWFLIGMLEQLRNTFFVRGLEGLGVYREEAVANIRAFSLNYFERFLYRSGKQRWADKTPGYVEYCPEIFEVFGPDVRFVYLLRHGMDVANSMQDRKWLGLLGPGAEQAADPGARLEVGARTWMRMIDNFEAFRQKHPSICHVVRFEDLTASPEATVRGVLEFLGEPWEPAIVDYRAFPHTGTDNGDPKTSEREGIAPNSGNYRSWAPEHQAAIRQLLAEHLMKYGYSAESVVTA
jgi:hypothetical protein